MRPDQTPEKELSRLALTKSMRRWTRRSRKSFRPAIQSRRLHPGSRVSKGDDLDVQIPRAELSLALLTHNTTEKNMAKVLCVLYPDPTTGYPPKYARDDIPVITGYPNGQTAPSPKGELGFTPGELGSAKVNCDRQESCAQRSSSIRWRHKPVPTSRPASGVA